MLLSFEDFSKDYTTSKILRMLVKLDNDK